MDNHAAVIEDDPLARGIAVHGVGTDPMIALQRVLDFSRNRFQMRIGCAGTDHKKIGEIGNAAKVERDDVFRLFFKGGADAELGE